jgi:cystathionine beta-lyase/cystathionine gamma-synthase
MISFEIEASTDETPLFLSTLNLFTLAESPGGLKIRVLLVS